ncbi:major facilitator superfamily domain-containing protein [Geopyxis carbonaria]|nr:major facilitator superfamily domain-containing protein [Geopyxis carbonaria]
MASPPSPHPLSSAASAHSHSHTHSPSRTASHNSHHSRGPITTTTTTKSSPNATSNSSLDATSTTPSDADETPEARYLRLGSSRPASLPSAFSEFSFCLSIMLSQMTAEYFISGFNTLLPTLSTALHIPSSAAVWPASAFSLTAGALLLPLGRLSDIYGGRRLYLLGMAWHAAFALIAGFSQSALMLDIARALGGIGPAAYLPAAVSLLARVYAHPGRRKNLVFSIYGACAPVGFFGGMLLAGVATRWLGWRWYFFIGAALTAVAWAASWGSVPDDGGEVRGGGVRMDWAGSAAVVAGLVLVVFAVTQSSRAPSGWRSWYILLTLILGVAALAAFAYIEARVAAQPLVPASMFRIRGMAAMSVALLFSYSCLGTWLFYGTFYLQHVLRLSPLLTVAWFVPFGLGGFVLPTLSGLVLHLVSGTTLLLVSAAGWVLCAVLFAVLPPHGDHTLVYWAYVFPAMIGGTVGIDITYNITNIWITTSMVASQQGLAGAWIWSLMFLGISLFLGIADVVHAGVGEETVQGYRAVFWFIAACAGVAFAVMAVGVRVEEAREGATADEKVAMAEAEKAGGV